jgi:protein TonB
LHSRYNTQNNQSLIFSAGAHGLIGLILLAAFYYKPNPKEEVEFTVYENPKVSTAAPQISKPKTEAPPKPSNKGVFGVSRRALSSLDANAPEVKAGNTIAKTPDQKILNANDPDALPIPTDEFLVTRMPELLSEMKIPYPPEAKKRGIQGAVVMDLLVDSQGVVRDAILVSGPDPSMNDAALQAIRKFSFRPALVQEKPVAVRIKYAYRFVLE